MRRPLLLGVALSACLAARAPFAHGDPKKKGPVAPSDAPWGDMRTVANAATATILPVRAPTGWVLPLSLRADMSLLLPDPNDSTGVLRVSQLDNIANGVVMGNLYVGFAPVTDVFASVTAGSLGTALTAEQNTEFDRLVADSIVPIVIDILRTEGRSLRFDAETVFKKLKPGKAAVEIRSTDTAGKLIKMKALVPSRATPHRFVILTNGAESTADFNVKLLPSVGAVSATLHWSIARYLNLKDDRFTSVASNPAAYAGTAAYRAEVAATKGGPPPTIWRFGGLASVEQKNVWMLAQATLPGSTILDSSGAGAEIWSGAQLVGRFEPKMSQRAADTDPGVLAAVGAASRTGLKSTGDVRRSTEHGTAVEAIDATLTVEGEELPHVHRTAVIGPKQSFVFTWITPKDFALDFAVGWTTLANR